MMQLIGMFDSPFVRPVAISMKLLGFPFEHLNWSLGNDFDRIRKYSPLGRTPTLVLDDGEALMESSAILDYLDELAGPEGAFRPEEKRHEPWLERCRTQMHGAVAELERLAAQKGAAPWLIGGRMTRADMMVTCIFTLLNDALASTFKPRDYPSLRALILLPARLLGGKPQGRA